MTRMTLTWRELRGMQACCDVTLVLVVVTPRCGVCMAVCWQME
jgi:hypothetical protein